MIGDLIAAIACAFRRVALPLAAYYAVTVAVPLANGAAQSGRVFVRHTLVVLIVPPILVVLLCVVRAGSRTVAHQGAERVSRHAKTAKI